jgi:Flp pilus assembly protein TadB
MAGDVRGAMDRYYGGERRDAALFAALGGANLVAAAVLLVVAPGQRFLTFALLSIGLIEIVFGFLALRRHERRHAEVREAEARDAAAYRAEESERLRRLLDARRRLRIADAAFFAAFVFVVALAPPGERIPRLAVVGQMALLPLLNVAMERRARRFLGDLTAAS